MSHKSGWDFVRFLRLLRISATALAEEADRSVGLFSIKG